jgi:hypothetical protein
MIVICHLSHKRGQHTHAVSFPLSPDDHASIEARFASASYSLEVFSERSHRDGSLSGPIAIEESAE